MELVNIEIGRVLIDSTLFMIVGITNINDESDWKVFDEEGVERYSDSPEYLEVVRKYELQYTDSEVLQEFSLTKDGLVVKPSTEDKVEVINERKQYKITVDGRHYIVTNSFNYKNAGGDTEVDSVDGFSIKSSEFDKVIDKLQDYLDDK